jgi:hypothetical protein
MKRLLLILAFLPFLFGHAWDSEKIMPGEFATIDIPVGHASAHASDYPHLDVRSCGSVVIGHDEDLEGSNTSAASIGFACWASDVGPSGPCPFIALYNEHVGTRVRSYNLGYIAHFNQAVITGGGGARFTVRCLAD